MQRRSSRAWPLLLVLVAPGVAAQSGKGAAEAEDLIRAAEATRSPAGFEAALDLLDPLLFRLDAPAEAWYLAGRAKLGLAELDALPRWRDHHRPGTTYAEAARRALTEALRRDPGHSGAAGLLAEVHERTRGLAGSREDLAAIRGAGASAGADTAYWLRRARSELEWDAPDSALAAVARYDAAGGDAALAARERARALFALGRDEDAAAAWFEGLGMARGAAAAEYRADLAWVGRPEELAAFDSLPYELRVAWARGFWERRALADFRTLPERLAEHYARIRDALGAFRVTDTERDFNSVMPYRSAQDLVDDRGVVWVRHGPPDEEVETAAGEGVGCGYVSWVYRHGADAGLSVHFRTWFGLAAYRTWHQFCSGRRDFRLVPGGYWIDHHAWWMADRDSLYAEWARAVRARRHHIVARLEREIGSVETRHLEVAVSTDGQPHRFARDLGAAVLAWPLGNPGRLLVVFGVPPSRLDSAVQGPGGRLVIPVRLRLAALPARGAPLTLDTTLAYAAAADPESDGWLLGHVEVQVAAGSWELRSLVTGAGADLGSGAAQPGLDVPFAAGPSISALVLGNPRGGLPWHSAAGEFPLSPSLSYGRDDAVAVFLEARGLPAAHAEVRMRVQSVHRPDRAVLELRTEEPVTGGRLALSRTIGLERLDEGTYVLVVEVAAPGVDGVPLVRRQTFVVDHRAAGRGPLPPSRPR